MKKKILLLTPYYPCPAHDGGKVRIFNLIKALSKDNDIVLLSYVESPAVPERYNVYLEQYCTRIYTVVRDESKRLLDANIPRSPTFYYTPEMVHMLEKAVEESKPNIVQIEFLIMTQYVNHIKNLPVIYTEHDMSSIDFEQSFHDRDMPEKLRFAAWVELVKYQKQILGKFSGIVLLTERDKHQLEQFSPGLRTAVVPTGVDIHYYSPSAEKRVKNSNIVFVGHFKHYPNVDAVQYFMKDIWRLILEKVADAKFYIVGSGAGEAIRKFSATNVVIAEDVEDVRVYLHDAAVFVAPVRLGGGIKGKVLEAMACGVPVVAIPDVCAGFENHPGDDILKASGERDFADQVIRILRNPAEGARLAENARRLVEGKYDWDNIARELSLFYGSFLNGKARKI